MTRRPNLVIRGGTIVDGSGGPTYQADIAVDDGVISEIGKVSVLGRQEIDADGLLVTPGFVDIHTHYDGQATWDSRLAPSSLHGVTTVVMGNCGVGFAPVRPEQHDMLIRLMEGVEDIPGAVLAEGLEWDWSSFPEYLDAIERVPHDIDLCAQIPHGALRVYVMGERGANREAASADEIARMSTLVREALGAGAVGFTSSRTLNHRTSTGDPTPTLTASEDELRGIARGLRDAKAGVMEMISDFEDMDGEFATFCRMVEDSGRPMTISVAQRDNAPGNWKLLLERIERAAKRGLPMKAQVCGRPIGTLFGLEGSLHPFVACPSYRAIADQPLAERVRLMRDPELRRRILSEQPVSRRPLVHYIAKSYHKLFRLGDPPDYEPDPSTSIAAQAQRLGRRPEEMTYDLLLENDGHELLYFPLLNYTEFSLDNARTMMTHEHTVFGLGDGGAHVATICDASFPTFALTHWARDRKHGRLELPWLVKRQTRDTAAAVGLLDRGLVAIGMKADINVIDFGRLRLRRPYMAYDLPANGRRLMQKAEGYVATIVSGEVTYRDGDPTGALPGTLVRGAQRAPTFSHSLPRKAGKG
ncbi:MAG: amidohydrolase [Candidatus Muproteobacteria bacterium RBG_16_60_9]|uniref:Amidohydrolase n=1 Tax=Candidatus Muproteobacteria bacterium RBG_16_60_9 TaxID=1817755 RepID=A0A1F6V3D6_9PROT|nr:MAG: amidohydrolase [Candidatus Muproteobacteria bacterium RBG_16_60_9]